MIRLKIRKRKVTSTRLIATAYCCTASERPGTGLAELRESCLEFAEAHRLRISAWAAEVTPDDPNLRYTSLLRYAIDFSNEPESDLLLIAESSSLIRSQGAAAFLAKTLSPEDSRIIVVSNSRSHPEM
jgi:hypothetical protein